MRQNADKVYKCKLLEIALPRNVNNKCQNLQVKNSKSKNSSRECKCSGERQYKTTYKAIKQYFRYINEGMFGGKLSPFNDVEIKELADKNVLGKLTC